MTEIEALNQRANKVGYEVVVESPPTPPASALPGVPFSVNMGDGGWCRILRDGESCFRFAWRAGEVSQWLRFREREARTGEQLAA